MSIDTHIKFDGVEGEAQHKDHKGELELLGWGWNVQNASAVAGGGSGKGKANPGEFVITHYYDKASPVLAKKCAQGVHFKEAVVTARKSGEGQKDFIKITLKEVYITSVAPSASAGGDIVESVTMSYGSIDFAYKAQDDKGGTGGEVKFGWNVKTTEIT
ncbi:type VI secretion system tube protein Hcp [Rubrivivax gelatinosus]|nr:type VI secretion system tube protein Hcp [Rubrivivax gelatinosus]